MPDNSNAISSSFDKGEMMNFCRLSLLIFIGFVVGAAPPRGCIATAAEEELRRDHHDRLPLAWCLAEGSGSP